MHIMKNMLGIKEKYYLPQIYASLCSFSSSRNSEGAFSCLSREDRAAGSHRQHTSYCDWCLRVWPIHALDTISPSAPQRVMCIQRDTCTGRVQSRGSDGVTCMLYSAFEEDLPDHKKEQKRVKRGKSHLNSRDQDLCADSSFVRASMVAQTVKKSTCNPGDWVWSLGGEEPMEMGMATCLEKPTDRRAWRATVCGVTKSQTRLSICEVVSGHRDRAVGKHPTRNEEMPLQGASLSRCPHASWRTTLLDILWAAGKLPPRDAPSSVLWLCPRPAQGGQTSAGIPKGFPDPIPNCVWGLPTPTSSLQVPAGHLKNQFNCSTIYPERDQIPLIKGSAPQDLHLLLTPTWTHGVTCAPNQPATNLRFWRPTPTQDTEHKPRLPPVLDQLATNQRFPQPSY